MRLIHHIPYCRDIAIWYDEYLIPGERWNDAIVETMLRHIAIKGNDSPEHNYLIGLAYLGAIDVERDPDIAVPLITDAAEHELTDAMDQLARMHHMGNGVKRDQMAERCFTESGASPLLLDDIKKKQGNLPGAKQSYETALAQAESSGKEWETAKCCEHLADICQRLGEE